MIRYNTDEFVKYLLAPEHPESIIEGLKDLYISLSRLVLYAMEQDDAPIYAKELNDQTFYLFHTIEAMNRIRKIEQD